MSFSGIFDPVIRTVQLTITLFYEICAQAGVPSYGLAIILFTVIIKMLLYPLTAKQVRSMKEMSKIQPKIKKLQEQYKYDPNRLQREMSQLFSNSGVSPLDGCLPLIVQMPILMAVYYALQSLTYEGASSFLWIPNLSEPDPYYILPVLSAVTTYFVSAQTMDKNNTQMKMMTYIMPVFIGYISLNFAAGLIVYWVAMNCVQIAQQAYMARKDEKNGKKDDEKEAKDGKVKIELDKIEDGEEAASEAKSGRKMKKVKNIRRPKKDK